MPFHRNGAFVIWFSYMTIGGKQEFERLYLIHMRREAPNICTSRVIECDGRLLAFLINALLAILIGGYMGTALHFAAAKVLEYDEDFNVKRYKTIQSGALVVFLVSSWTVLAGKLPHTTWFTRFCVRVVEKLSGR